MQPGATPHGLGPAGLSAQPLPQHSMSGGAEQHGAMMSVAAATSAGGPGLMGIPTPGAPGLVGMPTPGHGSLGMPTPGVGMVVGMGMPLPEPHQHGQPPGSDSGGGGLYGMPDTMLMPIHSAPAGGGPGGMINLCDLQPNPVSPAQPALGAAKEPPTLEMLASSVQHDDAFLAAVANRQPDAAALAAVKTIKALLARDPSLLQTVSGRPSLGGATEAFYPNQRVVVHAHKKTPSRLVGQEAVVVSPPANEWMTIRILQTGESVRVHPRGVLPIMVGLSVLSHHDLMDNDDLDGLPDIDLLGTDGDIILGTAMPGTAHSQPMPSMVPHGGGGGGGGGGAGKHLGGLPPPHSHAAPGMGLPGGHPQQEVPMSASFLDAGPQPMQVAPPPEPQLSAEEQAELLAKLQAELLALEAKVPWVLAKVGWQRVRADWVTSVRRCGSVEEWAHALRVLYDALALNKEEPHAALGLPRLMGELEGRLAAGRPLGPLLARRWDEAAASVEAWLDRQGALRLAGMEAGLLKALLALERAALDGEEAALQVPLEAMVGRSPEALAVLAEVLERERAELLSKSSLLAVEPEGCDLGGAALRAAYASEAQATFRELLGARLAVALGGGGGGGGLPDAAGDDRSEATDLDDSDMEELSC